MKKWGEIRRNKLRENNDKNKDKNKHKPRMGEEEE